MADEDEDDNSGLVIVGLLLLGLFAIAFTGGGGGAKAKERVFVTVTGSTCTVDGVAVDCSAVAPHVTGRSVVLRVTTGSQGVVEALIADLEAAGVEYAFESE